MAKFLGYIGNRRASTLSETITVTFKAPAANDFAYVDLSADFAYIISRAVTKTDSGSATVTVSIAGTAVTGLEGVTADDSQDTHLPTALNQVALGNAVKILVPTVSTAVNLGVQLTIQRL